MACQNVGEDVDDHFASAVKVITAGKGAHPRLDDYTLSRFACYLVAMNGDPRKAEIAAAQAYFAIQTRRMEQWDEMREALHERVELRQQLTDANRRLDATALEYGLNRRSFGRLHDAGTRALYGGLTLPEIKTRKGIPEPEDLADRMGPSELAASLFVRTQTEEKVRNENILGTNAIIDAHHDVAAETRATIERIGGTMPKIYLLNHRFAHCSISKRDDARRPSNRQDQRSLMRYQRQMMLRASSMSNVWN